MRTVIAGAALVLALSACSATPEETRAQALAEDRSTCEAYGVPVGHPDFSDCMLAVDQARRDREYVAAQERMNAGMVGAALFTPLMTPQPAPALRPSVNCWNAGGGVVTCR